MKIVGRSGDDCKGIAGETLMRWVGLDGLYETRGSILDPLFRLPHFSHSGWLLHHFLCQ